MRASAVIVNACTVEGCNTRCRSARSPYCERHYYRMRRNGSLDQRRKPAADRRMHSSGYVILYRPGHPLADAMGYVYEHRTIIYNRASGECPPCDYCGAELTWRTIEADHRDRNRANNNSENLANSCGPCNRERARPHMIATMQARAQRIEFQGESLTFREWADRLQISIPTLKRRLRHWPLEKALTASKIDAGPKSHRERDRQIMRAECMAFAIECATGQRWPRIRKATS